MPPPRLPLPLPSPEPEPSPQSTMTVPPSTTTTTNLPTRINTATRPQHTELNRLLIARLPFALPPHQPTPLLFAQGILPFAHIFHLFESEWDHLTRAVHARPAADDVSHDDHVRRWLAHLRPPGLARSPRLRADLSHLAAVTTGAGTPPPGSGDAWTRKMRRRFRAEPHVLVAFAWVFYMATFAGGRWIREQLANGGAEFWTGRPSSSSSGLVTTTLEKGLPPGFSFLSFDGDCDGEDIKAVFKLRLADAEVVLTPRERQDVVDTAQMVFERCVGLVGELDRMVVRDRVWRWLSAVLFVLWFLASLVALRVYGNFTRYELW